MRPRRLLMLPVIVIIAPAVRGEGFTGAVEGTGSDITARFFHRAGMLPNGQVIVTGGMRLQLIPPSLISLTEISFFDPDTGTLSAVFTPTGGGDPVVPELAVARSHHTQTTLEDGRVLVTGGRTGASGRNPGAPIASVELFDPVTGVVSGGPAMSATRAGHTATRLRDGRVVVVGESTWQVFDPSSDEWTTAFALQRSRRDHAAVLLPGKGGADEVLLIAGSGSGPATLERLDADTGTSTLSAAGLFIGVDDVAAVRQDDGTVLIVGGQDLSTGDTIALTYRYDPDADAIVQIPSPPDRTDGIADHQLVSFERFTLLFGGEQEINDVDCELDYAAAFDRVADDWVFVSTMSIPRDDFAAVRLNDDRILLVDGGTPLFGAEAPTNEVEVFTAATRRPADVDGDGQVTFADVLALLTAWGPCPPDAGCHEDLDFNGHVAFGDVLLVLSRWGPCE